MHVIATDGNAVETGHLLARVFDDIGDDTHRRLWRVNVGVPHHELFQDVVLDRS